MGAHIDVVNDSVRARWNDRGSWQEMVIRKRTGNGVILPGDVVCFRAHTGKHLDVEGGVVRARWNDCSEWQAMRIQKEVIGAVFSGASIHLLAHTGKRIEVEGRMVGGRMAGAHTVQARWSEPGQWQTFTI